MKRLAFAIIVVASIWAAWTSIVQSHPPRVMAEFPGASLKWVHAAEPEFHRKKLDLDKYTVSVFEEDNSVTVSLSSLDSVPGARGSTGTSPGYEVEISKKDLRVLRANYVR